MLIDQKILHVHIPRTGGRFIKELFKHSNYKIAFFEFDRTFRGKEVAHLTFPEYEFFYDHANFKKFSVVRDPVDKFLSAINNYGKINNEKIEYILKTQNLFDEFINNTIYNDCSNYFVPQVNFLDYKTKIYKYEEGLNINFNKWLSDNFNLGIIPMNYIHDEKKSRQLYISNKQKKYIENYYYKDYKILGY